MSETILPLLYLLLGAERAINEKGKKTLEKPEWRQ